MYSDKPKCASLPFSWRLALMLVFLFLVQGVDAITLTLEVSNPTADQRREVVAFDARKIYRSLGVDYATPLIVRNTYGQQVLQQLASDSTLLIEAAVFPHGKTTFTVTTGQPIAMPSYVDGRVYAWRVDDFTWENDLMAYRAYGPALQRSGEKAYGFDVWLKSVPQLVVANRYTNVYAANQLEMQLREQGRKAEADSVKRENSLHLDHGNGLDCYNVGPTLGCGTPALMIGDSIVMPYCYDQVKVLDNGPLRFTAELVYLPTNVDRQKGLVEHRLISLDKGSFFNRITVWYENLKKPQPFCAGVVVHRRDTASVVLGANYVSYADPTDNPEGHGFQIYVATLFPEGNATTQYLRNQLSDDIAGHAVCRRVISPNERFTYYFGAGWTGNGVRNQVQWQEEINTALRAHQQKMIGVIGVR